MFRLGPEAEEVTCTGCGISVPVTEAREYDKYGNRWERVNKRFDNFCKPCHRDLCLQPRDGLEELLVDIEAHRGDRTPFLSAYREAVDETPDQ